MRLDSFMDITGLDRGTSLIHQKDNPDSPELYIE